MSEEQHVAKQPTPWRNALDLLATIAIIVAAGGLLWRVVNPPASATGRKPIPVPSLPISLAGAAVEGQPTANVTMLEYSEFECPFCRQFAREILPVIRSEYVEHGTLKIAFRHFPLPVHANAQIAAEASLCAQVQGKFWAMHDAFFATPQFDKVDIAAIAASVGLDRGMFGSCMKSPATATVAADLSSGKALGVSGTPSFFVGLADGDSLTVKQVISGARPVEEFRKAIDLALSSRD